MTSLAGYFKSFRVIFGRNFMPRIEPLLTFFQMKIERILIDTRMFRKPGFSILVMTQLYLMY